MGGRLDRYVARTVAASWVGALLLVLFLFVVFDLLLEMTDYLEAARAGGLSVVEMLGVWALFQAVSLPAAFVTVAPFVTVIGCMFAVARHMAANEVTPMVFTGRSTRRVLRPALAMGVLAAVLMASSWELAVPRLTAVAERLRNRLGDEQGERMLAGIVLMSREGGRRLMVERYYPDSERMEGVVLVEQGSQPADLAEVRAQAARWHPGQGDWQLGRFRDGLFRPDAGGVRRSGELTERQKWLEMGELTPELVWLSGREARAAALLSFSEISTLLQMSPERYDLVVAMHYHLTWPLANVVLLLLALPFAVHFERGSRTGRVILAIAICAGYLVLDLACQNLGRRAWLQPVVAAWTPIVVFGSLGAVMFGGMRT